MKTALEDMQRQDVCVVVNKLSGRIFVDQLAHWRAL